MVCNEKSIGFLLNRAARTYSHYVEVLLAEKGHALSHEQFALLMELYKEDHIPQQTLAEKAFRGKTSITRLLAGMEEKGYISRMEDKIDKRKRLVCLTELSLNAKILMKQIAENSSKKSAENLDESEIELLKSLLEKIFLNCREFCDKEIG